MLTFEQLDIIQLYDIPSIATTNLAPILSRIKIVNIAYKCYIHYVINYVRSIRFIDVGILKEKEFEIRRASLSLFDRSITIKHFK